MKSKAGKRTIGLPRSSPCSSRNTARSRAGNKPSLGSTGKTKAGSSPGTSTPNTDYHEWKTLQEKAGVSESRLYDARHSATRSARSILPVVDIGLPHSDVEALADLEEAITHLRGVLADEGPGAVPESD